MTIDGHGTIGVDATHSGNTRDTGISSSSVHKDGSVDPDIRTAIPDEDVQRFREISEEINRAEALERAPGRWGYRFAKRTFDLAFSTCAIGVLLVPSLVLCAAISIETPGGPIYHQTRVGRHKKHGGLYTFDILKFRSMYKDADKMLVQLQDQNEASAPLFKMKNDPRVTGIGHFIRKHSIDEFPQLVNVWLGQLSLVGPRPPLPGEVEHYDARALKRLSIKPGLTGYWQVRGRSDLSFEDMVDLDLKYIEERSVLVDLMLIGKTIVLVFTGDGGAY